MVGILLSYWEGLFSGAMLVSGRVPYKLMSAGGQCHMLSKQSIGQFGAFLGIPTLVGGFKKICESQIGSSLQGSG